MKFRIWQRMLVEVMGSKPDLMLLGEVEANSHEEARQLALSEFSFTPPYRIDDGQTAIEYNE